MMSLKISKDNSMPEQNKQNKSLLIEIVTQEHCNRKEVERFIQASYEKNFSAQLKTFFPKILTVRNVNDNAIIAAVGIRLASREALFSECYLTENIEQTIAQFENTLTTRSKIVELGSFAVNNRKDIKTVIPFLGRFIKTLNVDWAIYTLTRPIKTYFHKLGIELNHITEADISKVNGAAKDWGRYYNFKPAVYYSSVKNNLN